MEASSETESMKTRAATYFPQLLQIRQSSKYFIAAARRRGDNGGGRALAAPPQHYFTLG